MRRVIVMAVGVWLLGAAGARAMESVPRAEYRQRRVALAEKLNGGVALLFAAEEPLLDFAPYRQDSDFYYLTGVDGAGGGPAGDRGGTGDDGAPDRGGRCPPHTYREILFLPTRNLVLEKYTGAKMDAATPGAAQTAGVDAVMRMTELPAVTGAFAAEDRSRVRRMWTPAGTSPPRRRC